MLSRGCSNTQYHLVVQDWKTGICSAVCQIVMHRMLRQVLVPPSSAGNLVSCLKTVVVGGKCMLHVETFAQKIPRYCVGRIFWNLMALSQG